MDGGLKVNINPPQLPPTHEHAHKWFYKDPQGQVQGNYSLLPFQPFMLFLYQSTVKPVYSDRPRDTQKVAFVDRFL